MGCKGCSAVGAAAIAAQGLGLCIPPSGSAAMHTALCACRQAGVGAQPGAAQLLQAFWPVNRVNQFDSHWQGEGRQSTARPALPAQAGGALAFCLY